MHPAADDYSRPCTGVHDAGWKWNYLQFLEGGGYLEYLENHAEELAEAGFTLPVASPGRRQQVWPVWGMT